MLSTIGTIILIFATIFLVYSVHKFNKQTLIEMDNLHKWLDLLAKSNLAMNDAMLKINQTDPFIQQKMDRLLKIVKDNES